MDRYTSYTLILGAEGQLGKAMAREIARKGSNLILVSTTSVDLHRFALRLQLKEDVLVETVKLNLADREAIQEFTDSIRNRYKIRALINNIAHDWSVAHNKYISEIASNDFTTRFRGAALMTMGLLPHLKQHFYDKDPCAGGYCADYYDICKRLCSKQTGIHPRIL